MIRKIGYLMGAVAITASYYVELDAFHYFWFLLLFVFGYVLYLSGCGIQKKTDTVLIYNKYRKSVYDYEPLQYWVRIDKRKKMVFLRIQDTEYAYFAMLPTVIRLFYPSKKYDISFEEIDHFIFSKRQTTLTTEGGGHQTFGVVWEIYAKLLDREQLFAESSDEYFMRRLARHIAILSERPLLDETTIPQTRYSPEELIQPYFSSVIKKDLGVRQGVRERRLDLYIKLYHTKNYLLKGFYLFFTVVLYFCYMSLIDTIIQLFPLSHPMESFLELGSFGVLFFFLFIPSLIPIRVSFFVSPHGITYLEQIPIFAKSYYFPKDDLYDISVCELHHTSRRNDSKLLIVSERHTFSVKATCDELVHLKKNLDAAIKAVLYFHFPEIVELDLPPNPKELLSTEQKASSIRESTISKEKPFVRFSQRRPQAETISSPQKEEIAPTIEKEEELPPEQIQETPLEEKEPTSFEISETSKTEVEPLEEEKISTHIDEENIFSSSMFSSSTEEASNEEKMIRSSEIETIPVVEFDEPEEFDKSEEDTLPIELLESEERIETLSEFSEESMPLLAEDSLQEEIPLSEEERAPVLGEDSLQEGILLLGEKQIIRAMNAFNEAIRKNPKLAEAYYQMGQIQMKLFEHPEGVESFSKALQYQPTHVAALEARAQAYNEMGDSERSRTDYESLMDLYPERAEEFQQKLDELPL